MATWQPFTCWVDTLGNDSVSVPGPGPVPVLADIQQLDARWLSVALDRQIDVFETHEIVGEGYASRMYRVIVRHEANAEPLSLILKLATANEAQRDLLSDTQLFREVYFYRYYSEPLRNTGMLQTSMWQKSTLSICRQRF